MCRNETYQSLHLSCDCVVPYPSWSPASGTKPLHIFFNFSSLNIGHERWFSMTYDAGPDSSSILKAADYHTVGSGDRAQSLLTDVSPTNPLLTVISAPTPVRSCSDRTWAYCQRPRTERPHVLRVACLQTQWHVVIFRFGVFAVSKCFSFIDMLCRECVSGPIYLSALFDHPLLLFVLGLKINRIFSSTRSRLSWLSSTLPSVHAELKGPRSAFTVCSPIEQRLSCCGFTHMDSDESLNFHSVFRECATLHEDQLVPGTF